MLDGGDQKGGEDASVRALAAGQGQIRASDAESAFTGYITDPLEGDLTQTGTGAYRPVAGSDEWRDGEDA